MLLISFNYIFLRRNLNVKIVDIHTISAILYLASPILTEMSFFCSHHCVIGENFSYEVLKFHLRGKLEQIGWGWEGGSSVNVKIEGI